VRIEQARSESEALFKAYMADVQVSPEIRRLLFDHIELMPAARGLGGLRRRFSKPLTALMILAALVLLAACVNTANLMLAKAMARQRDFAVRLTIGAGRGRLIRQSLTESLALVGAGAALGLACSHLGETALAAFFAEGNNQIVLNLSLNIRVLLFTMGVALLSGLAIGIAPAMRAARVDPEAGLHGGSRGGSGSRVSVRLSRTLVVAQVALSTLLLADAGLFTRTLRELKSVDLGFARESILTMQVTPERQWFGAPEWLALESEILDGIRRIPGIRSAGWATMNPLSGRDRGAIVDVPGFTPRAETDKHVHLVGVSPDYFSTLGIPMLLGRPFTARDSASAPKVAIINETAARFYFGTANPIGRKVRFTNYPNRDLLYEVAGVVRDVKHDSVREPAPRFIYVPLTQSPDRIGRLALAARCAGEPMAFAAAVRRQIQGVRSTLLINNVSTMERQLEEALLRERLITALSTAFGFVALALASIGVYGILAYTVARRTNESGYVWPWALQGAAWFGWFYGRRSP
jgi:predicted permease